MLSLEGLKHLHDVVSACEKVKRFTEGIDLAAYRADDMRRSAVERQFEIIGEAMGQLVRRHSELASEFPEFKRIIAFRNRLVHGYADVDDDVVWGIIVKDLSALHQEAAHLLAESEKPETT